MTDDKKVRIKGRKYHKIAPRTFVECAETAGDDHTRVMCELRPGDTTKGKTGYMPRKLDDGDYAFDPVRTESGPAKFNSRNFRSNYDQVFGDGEDRGVGGLSN